MRTHEWLYLGLAVFVTLAAIACGETVDSSSVDTDGVYAEFSATGTGDNTTDIQAGLKTGGPNSNTFLELNDGDELNFFVNDDEYEPNLSNIGGGAHYLRTIDGNGGGTNIRIAFSREEKQSARDSEVELPNPFVIESPSSGESFSRENDSVEIQLSNSQSGPEMVARLQGDCLDESVTETFSGDTVTISASAIASDEEDPDAECTVDIEVDRTREGTVDNEFSGGEFEGVQRRTASFESVP